MTSIQNPSLAPDGAVLLSLNTTNMWASPAVLEHIRRETRELCAKAQALQGPRALESTLSATKYHEAGHAVVHTHFGVQVVRCKISQCKRGPDRGQWVGETFTNSSWRTDSTSSPDDDFRQACGVAAGVLAESEFDRDDFRQGSSIDEVLLTKVLAHNIAVKTGVDPEDVMRVIVTTTVDILKKNAGVVHDIASELERRGAIRGERLAAILCRVKKTNTLRPSA